jgi:hypothetical protein
MKKALVNLLILALLLLPAACGGDGGTALQQATPTPAAGDEFAIPADFLRYDDPSGLYSISYPPDWEVDMEVLGDAEIIIKERFKDDVLAPQIEDTQLLFLAGVPQVIGYRPNVIVSVEPLPPLVTTIESAIASAAMTQKTIFDDYSEISREFIEIDGREAGILEFTGAIGEIEVHDLLMFTIVGETAWGVICTSFVADDAYSQYEVELHAIIRSLQIND